ncbi:hypothetical protein MMC12_003017 [Toensbergia leucococca]|nr:hypothetical protein [Toensbergia leucococca]
MSSNLDPVSGLHPSHVDEVVDFAVSVPSDPTNFANQFGKKPFEIIRTMAHQLRTDKRIGKSEPLKPEQCTQLHLILGMLSSIEGLTESLATSLYLKISLETVVAPTTLQRTYSFPPPFPEIAAKAIRKYESEDWGKNSVPLDDDGEVMVDDDGDAASTEAGTRPYTTKKSVASILSIDVMRRPRPNHPIYGTKGIMRGILISDGGQMRTYKIDTNFTRRDCRVVGHNGLEVGQWWPLQLCAVRDGAHGARMAGIAGSSKDGGAFSIVVSGLYSDLDRDRGELLYYSGSQSHDNTNPSTPIISNGTRMLQLAYQNGRPLRVLRTALGEHKCCPSVGIRYDGLYHITGQEQIINLKGGAYVRFRLERSAGQAPINVSRPNWEERDRYGLVKDGY